MNFLGRFEEQTYALFRMMTGFLFLWHGTQKLLNFPLEYPYGPLTPITTAAGVIELVGGILIMVGLLTRPVAFVCSGTMAVAYWMAHGLNAFFPLVNHGELAAFYCFAFLFIAAKGAGIWSIDSQFAAAGKP